MYFYLGHFSRFLPPGAQRIAHDMVRWEYTDGLEYATFLVQREEKEDTSARESRAVRLPGKVGQRARSRAARRAPSAAHPSSEGADVVIVMLNTRDRAFDFEIALGSKRADIHILPHTIQTIVFDAKLLK
jgi:hypothetical protein